MAAGPSEKRRKVELEVDTIFSEFKKDKNMMESLKYAFQCIEKGFDNMKVRCLKIEETNARAPESFSNATCTTKGYFENNLPVTYSIGSLFGDGTDILRGYIYEENCLMLPENGLHLKALKKLLIFLKESLNSLETPRKNIEPDRECDWAVQLAEHLFSRLAIGCRYTIENHYSKSHLHDGTNYVCPCEKKEKLSGVFNDTSFGCSNGWHGSVDIYLENLTVDVSSEDEEESEENNDRKRLPSDSSDNGNESSVEVKKTGKLSQLLAQTIVFSFLQRKQNDGKMDNFLIPSVGVNTNSVIVHFYDCENDVLLQSAVLKLFYYNDHLNVSTVVFLWLVLNYKCFCSGTPEEIRNYKADFPDCVGNKLQIYLEDVVKPIGKVTPTHEIEIQWDLMAPRVIKLQPRVKFQMIEKPV